MKFEEAAILMQCHCPGLPGTEDPRITKAVRMAEKDPALQGDLARQRAADERRIAEIRQIAPPGPLVEKIAEAHAAGERPLAGKGALLQPVVLAIVIGALVLLGWAGWTLWDRSQSFPGKDSVMRMVEVNDDEATPAQMELKKEPAGALEDWFFDKGFEDYFLPAGFEKYEAAGARLFKQDGEPVAQVAIADPGMVFYSFKADDFGVTLPANDEWRLFKDGDWIAAVQRHGEDCFMVAFRGSWGEMEAFLKAKR